VIQYCFLTTTGESLTLLYIFSFSYSMLSVIHDVYINMCSFHWILLDIQVDKEIVEVGDPLNRGLEGFRNLQDFLQR
jgi:hypothetical protein